MGLPHIVSVEQAAAAFELRVLDDERSIEAWPMRRVDLKRNL